MADSPGEQGEIMTAWIEQLVDVKGWAMADRSGKEEDILGAIE